MTGIVKKIVEDRGFGFIKADNGKDVFFHHSVCDNNCFDNLKEGDKVEYTLADKIPDDKKKGPRAASVKPV